MAWSSFWSISLTEGEMSNVCRIVLDIYNRNMLVQNTINAMALMLSALFWWALIIRGLVPTKVRIAAIKCVMALPGSLIRMLIPGRLIVFFMTAELLLTLLILFIIPPLYLSLCNIFSNTIFFIQIYQKF